ncbi:unnamed protein product [Hermetia illucens]|uniref:Integrase catalytic domain-containing protein n=1 Tax=Hermetia illucens TaxID=343691 RepID=A0A7R8V4K4_HERIL|nr:unnamed protein product [Hermetia illucens]
MFQVINIMGKPKKLIVDQDACLTAECFKNFLTKEKVKVHIVSSKTGLADIERFHGTMNEHIRILRIKEDKENIDEVVEALKHYNHTLHSTTGQRPIDLHLQDEKETKNKVNKSKWVEYRNNKENRKDVEIDERYVKDKNKKLGRKYRRVVFIIIALLSQVDGQVIKIVDMDKGPGYIVTQGENQELIKAYEQKIYMFNITDYLLENMITHLNNRSKRGLINIVGKGLKYLYGTLDDDDRIKIMSEIDNLHENQKNIIKESNKFSRISDILNNEIRNITNALNTQNRNLKDIVRKTNSKLDSFNEMIMRNDFLQHLIEIENHVTELKQAINFSKQGIPDSRLISESEINLKQFTNIKKKKYFIVNIIPICNKENIKLNITPSQYLVRNKEIFHVTNKETDLVDVKDDRILSILKNVNGTCSFVKSSNRLIESINENMIITQNLQATKIYHNCNNRCKENILGSNQIF